MTTTEKKLISGGTGFIGSAIAHALLREQHTVRILGRNRTKIRNIFGYSVEIAKGDLTQQESLLDAVDGINTVIQCAQFPGHPVETRRKGYTYWNVDALGTEHLIKAAIAKKVQRIIYISGAGTGPDKTEPWFRAKWHAEECIRKSGIPFTILRPSIIYGAKDKSVNRMIQALRLFPVFPLIGGGKNPMQPIFIEDLAKIVAGCIRQPERALHQTFDVGGPEEMTMKEMLQRILRLLNKKRWLISVPKIPLKVIDFLTMNVHLNIAPFRETFPEIKLRTLEEGMSTYLKI